MHRKQMFSVNLPLGEFGESKFRKIKEYPFLQDAQKPPKIFSAYRKQCLQINMFIPKCKK